jgi:glutaredoxin 3
MVTIYTTRFCPYCIRAKELLGSKGADYTEIAVDAEPGRRLEMTERSGRRTVPQIWIGEQHVGGCDDLYALERQGRLDDMLAAGSAPGH